MKKVTEHMRPRFHEADALFLTILPSGFLSDPSARRRINRRATYRKANRLTIIRADWTAYVFSDADLSGPMPPRVSDLLTHPEAEDHLLKALALPGMGEVRFARDWRIRRVRNGADFIGRATPETMQRVFDRMAEEYRVRTISPEHPDGILLTLEGDLPHDFTDELKERLAAPSRVSTEHLTFGVTNGDTRPTVTIGDNTVTDGDTPDSASGPRLALLVLEGLEGVGA